MKVYQVYQDYQVYQVYQNEKNLSLALRRASYDIAPTKTKSRQVQPTHKEVFQRQSPEEKQERKDP